MHIIFFCLDPSKYLGDLCMQARLRKDKAKKYFENSLCSKNVIFVAFVNKFKLRHFYLQIKCIRMLFLGKRAERQSVGV